MKGRGQRAIAGVGNAQNIGLDGLLGKVKEARNDNWLDRDEVLHFFKNDRLRPESEDGSTQRQLVSQTAMKVSFEKGCTFIFLKYILSIKKIQGLAWYSLPERLTK